MPDELANRPRSLFRIKMTVLIIAFLGSWVAIAFHLVRDINELRIFGLMMLCAYSTRFVHCEVCHSSIYYRRGGVRKLFWPSDSYGFIWAGSCPCCGLKRL